MRKGTGALRVAIACVALAVGALTWTVSVALASGGSYDACTTKASVLKLTTAAGGCPNGTTAISIGATGLTGRRGRLGNPGYTGPRGYTGLPGPVGPTHVYDAAGDSTSLGGFQMTKLVDVAIPAGRYMVVASGQATNDDGSKQYFECNLFVNYDDSLSNSIDYEDYRLFPRSDYGIGLQGIVVYDNPGFAVVGCATYNGSGHAHIDAIRLNG